MRNRIKTVSERSGHLHYARRACATHVQYFIDFCDALSDQIACGGPNLWTNYRAPYIKNEKVTNTEITLQTFIIGGIFYSIPIKYENNIKYDYRVPWWISPTQIIILESSRGLGNIS